MRLLDADRLHERGDIVGEQFHRISASRLVGLACSPRVERDASEMLGIVGDLEGFAACTKADIDLGSIALRVGILSWGALL